MLVGLVFLVIVLGWMAFLVPSFVARRSHGEGVEIDPFEEFGEAVRIVSRSSMFDEQDADVEVSTPLTRRAARAEVREMARTAARRRRNVVLVLAGATVLVAATVPFTALRWYAVLVPAVLLVAFLAVARFSVVKLNASLDRRLAALETDWREDTIGFEVPADLRTGVALNESTELSIEISAPIEGLTGGLWEPIPVTVPTYVSKPLVPRTVRTIDLSAPEPTAAIARTPVVAEAPQPDVVVTGDVLDEERRAVNE